MDVGITFQLPQELVMEIIELVNSRILSYEVRAEVLLRRDGEDEDVWMARLWMDHFEKRGRMKMIQALYKAGICSRLLEARDLVFKHIRK